MKLKEWFKARKERREAKKLEKLAKQETVEELEKLEEKAEQEEQEQEAEVERRYGLDAPVLEPLGFDEAEITPPETRMTDEYLEFLKHKEQAEIRIAELNAKEEAKAEEEPKAEE